MSAGTLRVSLRETRLVTERIVMLLGVPKGAWPAVREAVVAAEALGLEGLAFLDGRAPGGWVTPEITGEDGPLITVAAPGAPAPFALPALLDLAVATLAEHGTAVVTVTGLTDTALLRAAGPLGARLGAHVRVSGTEGAPVLETSGSTTAIPAGSRAAMAGGEHLLEAALHGLAVPAALWWRLYHRSNEALTEDTPLSRNHAGAALLTGGEGLTETDPDYVAEAAS
ncbi:hypothetical protein SAMN05421630_109307 [Prauserella marina]|uniref:Uncharacterized protein n=1 Tax=Prauserella marina TaxID=530584 RepID=A0A1G6VKH2_9PSEU|nr:hypothetical protein [Prauserella marina]PWV80430.1 hypothetical protein DES30_103522 [Prauserella marina]SDD54120.1 hypothetical protein SAMN05421630_109307 [Prauserella marina]